MSSCPPEETNVHFLDAVEQQPVSRRSHSPYVTLQQQPYLPGTASAAAKTQSSSSENQASHTQQQHGYRPVHLRMHGFPGLPPSRRTQPLAWFIAVLCAVLWVVIFLFGLVVLIICLVYRPRIPRFDVSTATLNAAHLDMANLLNADLTLLANISNPNEKLTVNFSSAVINLYFGNTMISSRSLFRFTERRRQSLFVSVHMVGSLVQMAPEDGIRLTKQMEMGSVELRVDGLLRVRTGLGSILSYSYWVHGHCKLLMSRPPGGVALKKQCFTKR